MRLFYLWQSPLPTAQRPITRVKSSLGSSFPLASWFSWSSSSYARTRARWTSSRCCPDGADQPRRAASAGPPPPQCSTNEETDHTLLSHYKLLWVHQLDHVTRSRVADGFKMTRGYGVWTNYQIEHIFDNRLIRYILLSNGPWYNTSIVLCVYGVHFFSYIYGTI